jgi:hypothetical protein
MVEQLQNKIKLMKNLLEEHTGYDMKFVTCHNCQDMNILYRPGGTFTHDKWSYCRCCSGKYWCGKCDAKWLNSGLQCDSCAQDE